MALSTDYAAAQLTYFKTATTAITDNRLTIHAHGHEIIRKLCREPPSQGDLLWLISFGLWTLLDRNARPNTMAPYQFESLLNVQTVWLKILDHHGKNPERSRTGTLALTDFF